MIHYGRPRTKEIPPVVLPEPCMVRQAANRVLALGCAVIAGFLAVMCIPQSIGETEIRENRQEGVAAVMSTAVTEREILTSAGTQTRENTADTGAEPFGYLDGEWNLWEYIGDLMWSLLS